MGKMGQRLDKTHTVIISEPSELVKLMKNSSVIIDDVSFLGVTTIEVTYTEGVMDGYYRQNRHAFYSPVVASTITAEGRCHLYDTLALLDKQAFYTDTLVFKLV